MNLKIQFYLYLKTERVSFTKTSFLIVVNGVVELDEIQ